MKNGHNLTFLLLATAILPCVTASCRQEEGPGTADSLACSSKISLTRSVPSSFISEINAFVYFADDPGLLDAYQNYDCFPGNEFSVGSTSGLRRIVLTANFPSSKLPYADVADYESLCGVVCDLSEDSPGSPFLSGETTCRTGPESRREIHLVPLLSRVYISSLEVDFSGHPYRKSSLENIKVYLTNVNGRCPLTGASDGTQSEIYNYGGYDPEDCRRLAHPEMIYREHPSFPLSLYCYPNNVTKYDAEVMGRAVTRLVIEGEIDGITYYYPLSIGDRGIERGMNYIFDIKITSTGMTDPDSEAESGMASFACCADTWTEYEEENEIY